MGHLCGALIGTMSSENDVYIRCPAQWVIRFGSVRLALVVASHGCCVFVLNRSQHTMSCPLLQGLACKLLGANFWTEARVQEANCWCKDGEYTKPPEYLSLFGRIGRGFVSTRDTSLG